MTSRLRQVPRHRRFVVVIAATLSASILGLGAPPAAAEPVLDANCPGPAVSGLTAFAGLRVAQTFTAQTTGSLVRGEIVVFKSSLPGPSGDWVMETYATASGSPTNTPLASTTIPDATVPTGESRLAGTFAAPANIQAGQQYAISVKRSADWDFRWRVDNPCPGAMFSGSSEFGWGITSDADLVFAVFVEPVGESGPGGEPLKADRTLTLETSKAKVKKGKKVRFFGHLDAPANEAGCESDQGVDLQRKKPHQDDFSQFEQLQTDAAGDFSTKEKVKKTFEYRAQAGETAACNGQVSDIEKVKVKKKT